MSNCFPIRWWDYLLLSAHRQVSKISLGGVIPHHTELSWVVSCSTKLVTEFLIDGIDDVVKACRGGISTARKRSREFSSPKLVPNISKAAIFFMMNVGDCCLTIKL